MFESTTSHPNPLRRMAAVVAGLALYELLPQAVLICGGEDEMGFFYNFLLDSPPVPEIAVFVKEKMKTIFSMRPLFRETEMVAASAAELFKKKGHLGALGQLEEANPKELVAVVQIADFFDLAEGPFEFPEKVYLDHIEIKATGEGLYRLSGCVDRFQDALKAHIKKILRYEKQNHLVEGVRQGLWFETLAGLVWQSKGLTERRKIITRIKEIFCHNIGEAAGEGAALHEWSLAKKIKTYWHYAENLAHSFWENGLFAEEIQNYFTIDSQDEEVICSQLLQKIAQFHTIFAFRPWVYVSAGRGRFYSLFETRLKDLGCRIERKKGEAAICGYVEDGLGRLQKIWELKEKKGSESFQFKLGVERIMALLVEMNLGK